MKFNAQQQEAIEAYKGAYGVVASPGAGKSTVLLNRVNNLVETHNESQNSILAISFTRATADELKSKLKKMGLESVNVGTFHSICMRILIQEGYNLSGNTLIKEWQAENLFKQIDQSADVKEILNYISFQKNYMRSPKDQFVSKQNDYTEEELRVYYTEYEKYKSENELYDFDDYLLICLEVLKDNPGVFTFEFVLVDEHQDSNSVQNLILQELCQSGNIFTVFDPKQAVYGFRAGNPEYAMNFEKYWDNARIINLYINYRSPKNIVDQSNHFIRKYFGNYEHYVDAESHRQDNGHISVKTHMDREVESIEVVDEIEKLIKNNTPLKEIAVIYRMNKQVSFVEAELKKRNIEYDIANDSSFFKRTEVSGIIAYLRLIQNVHDDNAFKTIFKLRCEPLKFFSNKVLNDIQTHAGEYDMSLYEAFTSMSFDKQWQKKNAMLFENSINKLRMQKDKDTNVITMINNIVKVFRIEDFIRDKYSNEEEIKERIDSVNVLKSFVKNNNLEQFITYVYSNNNSKKKKEDAIQLMSIHKSKGLEFDNVFLIGVEDSQFPHDRSDRGEEARLMYVAVTRSKQNLYINEIGSGNQFIKEYGIESSL